MTFMPVERMPSDSASASSGEWGRMSRPTTIVFSLPTLSVAVSRERWR